MYSAKVLDHFKSPRNVGEIADATSVAEVANPACGDLMQLSIRVEGAQIAAATFRARGCVTAIACGSVLTEMLVGKTIEQARAIQARMIAAALDGLPPSAVHGSQLAYDALETALSGIKVP